MRTTLSMFGQNVKKLRTSKHLSQEELAALSGLHRTYISTLERGKRNVSLINIKKIALALNVKLGDLLKDI